MFNNLFSLLIQLLDRIFYRSEQCMYQYLLYVSLFYCRVAFLSAQTKCIGVPVHPVIQRPNTLFFFLEDPKKN